MRRSPLMTASLIGLVAGMGALSDAMPTLRSAGSGNNRRPTPPRMDTKQAREIAAHNAEVDRRKAEKRLRKSTESPR